MPINLKCPQCQVAYALADSFAGKHVRCQKCQQVFAVPLPVAARPVEEVSLVQSGAPSAPYPARRELAPPPSFQDDELDWPRERRSRGRRHVERPQGHTALWIGVAAAVMLLVGVAVGLTVYFVVARDRPAAAAPNIGPVAAAPAPAPLEAGKVAVPVADGMPFRFTAPPGWEWRDFGGLKHKIVAGPPARGFAPNINIVDEPHVGSVRDYAQASILTLRAMMKNFRLLSQGDFSTAAGLRGYRIVFENEQGVMRLRQTAYVFGKDDTKFVVTCTVPAEDGASFDAVFENSMRTFAFP